VTIRKARRARNRALVVPGIMSLLMWMVLGELLLRRPGPVVMPALALLLAVAAITPVVSGGSPGCCCWLGAPACTNGTLWPR